MELCNTRDENANLEPPENWVEERDGICHVLPCRVKTVGIYNHFTSTWKPTRDELAKLIEGGVIEVTLVGTQAPMRLDVVDPVDVVRVDSHEIERSQRTVVINEDAHGHG